MTTTPITGPVENLKIFNLCKVEAYENKQTKDKINKQIFILFFLKFFFSKKMNRIKK